MTGFMVERKVKAVSARCGGQFGDEAGWYIAGGCLIQVWGEIKMCACVCVDV